LSSSNASAAGATLPGPLDGFRVVELAGLLTPYCGKMFSDLGAEVILVEPPMGSRLREEPPFLDGTPGPDRSLAFAYQNSGKKSVTLDIDTAQGQALFRSLAASADLVLESSRPGVLKQRGLDYAALSADNPGLVMTSVTAFGQDGPYSHHAYSDLTLLAMGGLLYLGGYPDSPPLRVYGNQAYNAASMFASVVSVTALYAVVMGGEGEHIDVSAQQCVALALESSVQMLELEGTVRKRYAGEQRQAGTGIFPTKDGYICVMASGISSNRFWNNTVKWLQEEKVPGADDLMAPEWQEIDYLSSAVAKERFGKIFLPFAAANSSDYLYQGGQKHRLPICPVCSPSQVLTNRQLLARNYFIKVDDPINGRALTMPGSPYSLPKSPWRIQGGPPRAGQHTAEVLAGLGVNAMELQSLAGTGVI
jgi:benzylsuccinate CoA-transferase BbsE subunit